MENKNESALVVHKEEAMPRYTTWILYWEEPKEGQVAGSPIEKPDENGGHWGSTIVSKPIIPGLEFERLQFYYNEVGDKNTFIINRRRMTDNEIDLVLDYLKNLPIPEEHYPYYLPRVTNQLYISCNKYLSSTNYLRQNLEDDREAGIVITDERLKEYDEIREIRIAARKYNGRFKEVLTLKDLENLLFEINANSRKLFEIIIKGLLGTCCNKARQNPAENISLDSYKNNDKLRLYIGDAVELF